MKLIALMVMGNLAQLPGVKGAGRVSIWLRDTGLPIEVSFRRSSVSIVYVWFAAKDGRWILVCADRLRGTRY